jgi:hypothetical protein
MGGNGGEGQGSRHNNKRTKRADEQTTERNKTFYSEKGVRADTAIESWAATSAFAAERELLEEVRDTPSEPPRESATEAGLRLVNGIGPLRTSLETVRRSSHAADSSTGATDDLEEVREGTAEDTTNDEDDDTRESLETERDGSSSDGTRDNDPSSSLVPTAGTRSITGRKEGESGAYFDSTWTPSGVSRRGVDLRVEALLVLDGRVNGE